MLSELLKFLSKIFFQLVLWTLLLSIEWQGQSFFERSQGLFLNNEIAGAIEIQLQTAWDSLSETAQSSLAKFRNEESPKKL